MLRLLRMVKIRLPSCSPTRRREPSPRLLFQWPILVARLYVIIHPRIPGRAKIQQVDFPSQVAGRVALISRGTCEFGLQSSLDGAAGADAAIIYDNIDEPSLAGTLGAPPRPKGPYVPTAGISLACGIALHAAANGGNAITVNVNIVSIMENRTT